MVVAISAFTKNLSRADSFTALFNVHISYCGNLCSCLLVAGQGEPVTLVLYRFTPWLFAKEKAMNSSQILNRLGSAALTIAVLSLLLLFVPGLVRADTGAIAADSFYGDGQE